MRIINSSPPKRAGAIGCTAQIHGTELPTAKRKKQPHPGRPPPLPWPWRSDGDPGLPGHPPGPRNPPPGTPRGPAGTRSTCARRQAPHKPRGKDWIWGGSPKKCPTNGGKKHGKGKGAMFFLCHPNMGWGWMNRTCCRGKLTVKAFPTDKKGTVPKVDHWLLQRGKLQKQTCQRGQVPKVHGNVKAT